MQGLTILVSLISKMGINTGEHLKMEDPVDMEQ